MDKNSCCNGNGKGEHGDAHNCGCHGEHGSGHSDGSCCGAGSPGGSNHGLESIIDKVLYVKSLVMPKSNSVNARRMLDAGFLYHVNHGVGLGDLLSISRSLEADHELALALRRDAWRECKLIAAFVDLPERVTIEQFDEWAADFNNTEIVDVTCAKLLCNSRLALAKSLEWCLIDNEFLQRAGLVLIAQIAAHHSADEDLLVPYVDIITDLAESTSTITHDGIGVALRQISQLSDSLRLKVDACLLKMSTMSNPMALELSRTLLNNPTAQFDIDKNVLSVV